MNQQKTATALFISTVITLLVFLPLTGRIHFFDHSEEYFFSLAGKLNTGQGLSIPGEQHDFPQFPPVFIWIQGLFVRLFGLNTFSLRLPGTLAGLLTLFFLYRAGTRVMDRKFGFIWMFAYAGSILPVVYFKSGLPLPYTNLFSMMAVSYFAYYFTFQENRVRNLVISGIFLSLASLTIGPVVLIIIGATFLLWLVFNRFRMHPNFRHIGIYLAVLLVFGGSWFLVQYVRGNTAPAAGVFHFKIVPVFSRGSFFLHPFVYYFAGLFPVSVFALPALRGSIIETYRAKSFSLWMRVFFWTGFMFVFFIQDSSSFSGIYFLPLSFLGAQMIYRIFQDKERYREYFRLIILFTGLTFGTAFMWIYLAGTGILESAGIFWLKDSVILEMCKYKELWTSFEIVALLVFLVLLFSSLYLFKDKRTGLAVLFGAVLIFLHSVIWIFVNKEEKLRELQEQGSLVRDCHENEKVQNYSYLDN